MQKFSLLALIFALPATAGFAGSSEASTDKAVTVGADHAIYEGSFNSGFKANDQYFDANVNIVAPVWSTLGKDGSLGGSVLFVEPYVSWGDNGEVATSLGFGFRHLFNDQPVSALRQPKKGMAGFWDEGVAVGGSFFVDMLDTEAGNQFWQLGVGAEVATRYMEIRGNYYIPTTDRKLAERQVSYETRSRTRTRNSIQNDLSNPYDNGQGLLVQDQTTSVVATTTTTTETFRHIFERYEEGLKGWDIEVAVLLPYIDQWTDVKVIGGYLDLRNSPFGPQTGGTGPVKGWKAGVEIRPVPAVAITGMWYEDKKFLGADWVVGARLEIPFEFGDIGDGKNFWTRIGDAFRPRRRHLVERLAEPVHRQNAAIKIGNSHHEDTQTTNTQTTSNVHVVSQTRNQIILGPAPSGTDFHYVTNGSVNVTTYNGSTLNTQNLSGSVYINGAGNTLLVPSDGSSVVVFASNITQNPTFSVPTGGGNTPPPSNLVLSGSVSFTNTTQPANSNGGSTPSSVFLVAGDPNTPPVTFGGGTVNLVNTNLTPVVIISEVVTAPSFTPSTFVGYTVPAVGTGPPVTNSYPIPVGGIGPPVTNPGTSIVLRSGGFLSGSTNTGATISITGDFATFNAPNSLILDSGIHGSTIISGNNTPPNFIVNSGSLNFPSGLTIPNGTTLQITNSGGTTISGTLVPMGSYTINNNSITLPDNTVVTFGL